jgi:predicted nucleic acid-binding protein
MTSAPVRVIVTDTNVLVNLIHVSRMELFGRIPSHEFILPDHVRDEITRPEQRTAIDAAIRAGILKVEAITEIPALELYSQLKERMGRGESACIALAESRGWAVASDERGRFRREALARVGADNLLGTPEIFVLAIQAGLLTIEEADRDICTLEQNRFKMPFGSFRDFLA